MALKRHISIRHLKSSYKVRIELVELEFQQAQSNVQTTFPYLLDVELKHWGARRPNVSISTYTHCLIFFTDIQNLTDA